MSAAHPSPTPFDAIIAAARRTALPTTLSLVELVPVRSAPPPRDAQAELEPHWAAAIDAATD